MVKRIRKVSIEVLTKVHLVGLKKYPFERYLGYEKHDSDPFLHGPSFTTSVTTENRNCELQNKMYPGASRN